MDMQYRQPQQLEALLPAEIILMVGNYLPFKSYIQFSYTCRTVQRILTSTNAIWYLNHRFKFGQDTGSLLLFAYYNILYIPRKMSKLVLNHFINSSKNDMSFLIKGWSLIHAIHCLDPGRFMTLLLTDEDQAMNKQIVVEKKKSIVDIEKRKKLLVQHQRTFAREIIDSIIASHSSCKTEVCKSKTYQTVFKNLVQSGDLRTVENCLRSLGSPIDCITLSDSDYNNRFPLIDQQFSSLTATKNDDDNTYSVETICKDSLYLNYNAHEMRSLTEKLLEKYNVKVNNATSKYTAYNSNSSSNFNTSFSFGSHYHHHRRHHHRRHHHPSSLSSRREHHCTATAISLNSNFDL